MTIWEKIKAFFKRLFGIKDKPPPSVFDVLPPPAPVSVWQFQYSPGMPPSPVNNAFLFPPSDGVHYLVQGWNGPLTKGLHLQFKIDATDAVFSADTGTAASGGVPHVTLYFQRRGDTMTADKPHYRWWAAGSRVKLEGGEFTIDVPLDANKWQSVFGASGDSVIADWQAAINDVQAVGMTFGGDFFGHGVFVPQGTAVFTIQSWSAL